MEKYGMGFSGPDKCFQTIALKNFEKIFKRTVFHGIFHGKAASAKSKEIWRGTKCTLSCRHICSKQPTPKYFITAPNPDIHDQISLKENCTYKNNHVLSLSERLWVTQWCSKPYGCIHCCFHGHSESTRLHRWCNFQFLFIKDTKISAIIYSKC